MSEDSKRVVRRFIELLNEKNTDALGEVWAEDLVWHGAGGMGDVHGLDTFKQVLAPFFTALPDLHTTIEDLVAENDRVASRVTTRATHTGDFMGIPPTGNPVEFIGIHVYRIADGKLAEEWFNDDLLTLMRQVGAVPSGS
jgi:steroid delta-isomerase-like uncharacterized protein